MADLNAMSDDALLRLDRELRVASFSWSWEDGTLTRPMADGRARLCLSSMSPNGRERERAIRALAELDDPAALPFLLIRTNDWVPQVQRLAAGAVRRRLSSAWARHFFRHVALLASLGEMRRNRLDDLVEEIQALLVACPAFDYPLSSPHRRTRMVAYALLAERLADPRETLARASRDVDPTIRLWAVRRMKGPFADEWTRAAFDRMTDDRCPAVRREVLETSIERWPDQTRERWERWALDGSASIRLKLRWWLSTKDFVAFYRTEVRGRHAAAALAGLAETGKREDAAWVAPVTRMGKPSVRRAAIRALSTLDAEGYADRLLEHLEDEHRGICREAADGLRKARGAVPVEVLWAVFLGAPWPHVKRRVLRLVNDCGKWEALPLLVEALRDPDVGDLASRLLKAWLDHRSLRGSTTPDASQRAATMRALAGAEAAVGAQIRPFLD